MTAPKPKPNALTRKLGPAPVWAWAAAGLILAWFLFLRTPSSSASSQTTQAPVTGSTAGVPSTGATGSTDANGNAGDLLAQLLQGQQSTIDKLAGAFVGGGQGATGSASGSGAGGASATSSAATASPDSGVAPSSVQLDGPAAYPSTGTVIAPSDGVPGGVITGDPEHNAFVMGQSDIDPFNVVSSGFGVNYGGQSLDVRDAAYATGAPVSTFTAATASQPTPYATVTPSPVDTSSIVAPTKSPTIGRNVAV